MQAIRRIMDSIEKHGLLLMQDARLLSVVGLVTAEKLKGSWWSHPRSHEIFACLQALAEDERVLSTKLVGGKVTFVHERLWPSLLVVAEANAPWQLEDLADAARTLLRRVRRSGEVRASGRVAKELEIRLLVHSREVHTESGRHEILLQSWKRLAAKQRHGGRDLGNRPSSTSARQIIEEAVRSIGGSGGELPWEGAIPRRRSPRRRA